MTRAYYRLTLSALCAFAAFGAPIHFLEDRPKAGYLLGGLIAAFLTWAFLTLTMAAEPRLSPWMQGALGAGAAVLSWATISLVAIFQVIPHALERGLSRFDPVWIMGGLAPLATLAVAWWRASRGYIQILQALLSALFRYSVPLFLLELVVEVLPLPKQYTWLFLFTGVMFLVLDALGAGGDLPLFNRVDEKAKVHDE